MRERYGRDDWCSRSRISLDVETMDMTLMKTLKRLCSAAALACVMAGMQAPAEAQRANVLHLAVGTKDDTATHKTIQQIKSVPPRKRSRCYG